MNTERFEIRNSLEANYLCLELEEPIRLDTIAMRVLKHDCPDFLIPYQIRNMNDKVQFSYVLTNDIALEYSGLMLTKDSAVRLFQSLLEPFIHGGDWFLDYHYLCIDRRYVYLNRAGDRARFVYVPEQSFRSSDEEILDFFKKLFYDIKITDDKDFALRLYEYFTSGSVTIGGFYKIMTEYAPQEKKREGTPVVNTVKTPPKTTVHEEKSEVRMAETVKKDEAAAASQTSATPDGIDIFNTPAKQKSGGILGKIFSAKKNQTQETKADAPAKGKPVKVSSNEIPPIVQAPDPVTEPSRQPVYSDETEVCDGGGSCAGAYLELIQSPLEGAPQTISLEFASDYIILGRMSNDETKPDVAFPAEFKRIGRRHLRIEKKGGSYYAIDLGSVNHTLLNGRVLQPNQPNPLQDMMTLQLTESQPIQYRVHL